MPYHNTTNSRAFNHVFNKFAGTEGVVYAQEFPMDVHDGAQYLARNRASIGRTFATQVLEGKVGPNCCLLGSAEHSDMTLRQRAVLSHMRETTSNSEFDSALHAAMEFGALPSSARHVFAEGYADPPMFDYGHAAPDSPAAAVAPAAPVSALASTAMLDVDEAPAQSLTPMRVTVNAGGGPGRSTPLQQKAKRARKVK